MAGTLLENLKIMNESFDYFEEEHSEYEEVRAEINEQAQAIDLIIGFGQCDDCGAGPTYMTFTETVHVLIPGYDAVCLKEKDELDEFTVVDRLVALDDLYGQDELAEDDTDLYQQIRLEAEQQANVLGFTVALARCENVGAGDNYVVCIPFPKLHHVLIPRL